MNYKLIYEHLVKRGQHRPIIDGYKESHHIIPRCMGGSDEVDNLVDLTPEEHFVAHQLLVKIYPENIRLVRACDVMSKDTKVNRYWRKNKMYGWLRRRLHVPRVNIVCDYCEDSFEALECQKRKFCSQACKNASQENKVILCCKGCNKNFEVLPTAANKRQYCSPECAIKWRYIHSEQRIKWSCSKCNKVLYIEKNLLATKKYCSKACRYSKNTRYD